MIVQLNSLERRMIRKIVKVQLECLQAILKGECEEDIELYCIERDVNKADMHNLIKRNIETFTEVYRSPNRFLELTDEDLSNLKHILETVEMGDTQTKAKLWRKMLVFEKFEYFLNVPPKEHYLN